MFHAAGTRFIAVAGPPCAGKSTIARSLAAELDAPHLEMDRFRERLLPGSDQNVGDRDVAYRAMHLTAELMAPVCETLILDATYTAAICRTGLADVVERVGGRLFVVECHIDATLGRERFNRRYGHPAVDLTLERVTTLTREYPYFTEACAVRPGATAPMETVLQCVRTHPLGADAIATWCRRGRARESGTAVRATS